MAWKIKRLGGSEIPVAAVNNMKKILRKTLGITLIILGFLALVTPFSPGSWLILIGLEILGFRFLLGAQLSRFFRSKYQGRGQNLLTKFKEKFKRSSRQVGEQDKEQASR